jgi:Nucleoside-diphosphate-sugar pyrophosphorylase involved in lipopolysaccharide biosynthesis/translation initiation factor 2B, gamma/epsilon subunits (eIF-2Bgamma/eIF-2Bepsilon)
VERSTIILAGGFGERTKGLLGDTPKLLIKTADGQTILDHILQDLSDNKPGATVVTNGYFYTPIAKYVSENYPQGSVDTINDQRMTPGERLGALGDLLFAIDKGEKADGDILVLPSDTAYWESFSIKDFLGFASLHTDSFVTVVYDVKDPEKIRRNLGCVVLDDKNRVTEFEEKPENPKSTLAIVAIYLFRPEHIKLLREFKESGGDLNSPSNIIPFLMERGVKISGFLSKGRVVDANGPKEISEAASYGQK